MPLFLFFTSSTDFSALPAGFYCSVRAVTEVTTADLSASPSSFSSTLRVFSKITFTTTAFAHVYLD
ncbi:hypothetical protein HA46_19405 [Pantoea septica]|uniref:Uncharacterized protein n=1 Tax=Pantoea septica TaxID=472695 RepID=A0ABX3UM36_9GAMM|nr:hypothetical protein HA46_19405 [Pantoea septica]